MAGTANSGGRNRKSVESHLRRGTFNVTRHCAAHVHAMPAPVAPDWAPLRSDLAAQGRAGKAFVARMLAAHGFSESEGAVLLEAGHAVTALQAVRAMSRSGLTLRELAQLERLELNWSKHFASLLGQLRVSA